MSEKLFFHLRGYRKRAALSQQELAELLGYSTDAIVSRYENRVRSVTLENALRFEAAFQTPVSELFSDQYAKVELSVINRARVMHAAIECEL
ncbi:MAG: helix-turn-helix transcriptional regulator [Pseudomonadota bacterium]